MMEGQTTLALALKTFLVNSLRRKGYSPDVVEWVDEADVRHVKILAGTIEIRVKISDYLVVFFSARNGPITYIKLPASVSALSLRDALSRATNLFYKLLRLQEE